MRTLEGCGFVERLWAGDAGLWSASPEGQALVKNRLGWLTAPGFMRAKLGEVTEFADEVRRSGYTHVVLLGMGGASLAAEVFARTFGHRQGFPDLLVLDSTDPAAVKQVLERISIPRTLFVVASKSGTTLEPLAFYRFFRARVEQAVPKAGSQFIAITDPGTPLEQLAKAEHFRRVFLNPPTIGGRYSAISYFGCVPAALIGVDLNRILEATEAMVSRCGAGVPARENPGVILGAALGALAKAGRDKVTLIVLPRLRALGAWVEQLLAESTGKNGRGLVPVDGELLGGPAAYGDDRFFVAVPLEGETGLEGRLAELRAAKHPVLSITLKDSFDLGAEFFRWEVATATAAVLLEVNPFDEPHVQAAKDNTATLLEAHRSGRQPADWPPALTEHGIGLVTHDGVRPPSLGDGLAAHLALAKPGDYLALLAYLPPGDDVAAGLQTLRTLLRDRFKLATTVGYGPRYLHSTGQLHKGGPDTGLFIQITSDDPDDLAVPGEPYSFGVLKRAQALGDLQALRSRGRRVIRLHLDKKPAEALGRLNKLVAKALQAS
ncbi:MAG: glucose-6-phosphate isomerase [Candidatus Rokubacteria bacterium]|nr:glucose-6-phosphate isomerase [Candidatus Rokubacteria bacterium]